MNSCSFTGYVSRDAELKHFPSGSTLATFGMAINRYQPPDKPQRDPLWLSVEVWGKQADIAAAFIKKSTLVAVTGEIDTHEWEDQKGNQRLSMKLKCRDFKMFSKPSDGAMPQGPPQNGSMGERQNPYRSENRDAERQPVATEWNSKPLLDEDDEIPF